MTNPGPPLGAGPESQPARPTWVRWRLVALLLVYSFLNWFNRESMAVAGNERIMEQFEISPQKMGWVYSSLILAYAFCMTPGGWLIDRYGSRTMLVFMGFGSALFSVLTGLPGIVIWSVASVWAVLLIVRLLMGACSAPIYPASGRIIAHWIPLSQRAWANSLVMGAATLGIACAPVTFGALIDWIDWPAAFLATGALTALAAVAWTAFATDYPGQHSAVNKAEEHWIGREEATHLLQEARIERPPSSQWTALFRNRSLMLLALGYGTVGYFYYILFFWMGHYLNKVLKLGTMESRYYTGLIILAMAVGTPLGGWLADRLQKAYGSRLGRSLVPAGGMIASAILLGLGLCATTSAWIVTWFTLAMFAIGFCEGPFWATAIELGGRRGATAAGMMNTVNNAAGFLAPILTPLIAGLSVQFGWNEQSGWKFGIGMGCFVCLVGACVWLRIDPNERIEEKELVPAGKVP